MAVAKRNEDFFAQAKDIMELFRHHVHRYTLGSSSSLAEDTARELMQGMLFCLSLGDGKALGTKLATGQSRARQLRQKAKGLWYSVTATQLEIDNLAYQDTIQEFRMGFKKYDSLYFAHDIPCYVDYPLAVPVPESLQGAQYMCGYLHSLLLENQLCGLFPIQNIRQLLGTTQPDAKNDYYSVCFVVMLAATLCQIANRPVDELIVQKADWTLIYAALQEWRDEDWQENLSSAAASALSRFPTAGKEVVNYGIEAVCAHLPWIHNQAKAGTLHGYFFTPSTMNPFSFDDAASMPDDALRQALQEMRECRFTADKLSMLTLHAKSTADLVAFLEEGFDAQELPEVYKRLPQPVLARLALWLQENETSPFPAWGAGLLQHFQQGR